MLWLWLINYKHFSLFIITNQSGIGRGYYSLKDYKISVDVVDPKVSQKSVKELYNISCMNNIQDKKDYSAVILAVPHEEFISKSSKDLKNLSSNPKVKFFDLKSVYPKNESDFRL